MVFAKYAPEKAKTTPTGGTPIHSFSIKTKPNTTSLIATAMSRHPRLAAYGLGLIPHKNEFFFDFKSNQNSSKINPSDAIKIEKKFISKPLKNSILSGF